MNWYLNIMTSISSLMNKTIIINFCIYLCVNVWFIIKNYIVIVSYTSQLQQQSIMNTITLTSSFPKFVLDVQMCHKYFNEKY